MRNYLKELRDRGYTVSRLSRETGLSSSKVSNVIKGKVKLKSRTDAYESIRNASRRLAYSEVREAGGSSFEATRLRRPLYIREEERLPQTEWIHRTGKKTTRWMVNILAEFIDPETGKKVVGYGTSKAKPRKKDVDEEEAIESAKGSLDNYDLKFNRIIETQFTKLVFSRPPKNKKKK